MLWPVALGLVTFKLTTPLWRWTGTACARFPALPRGAQAALARVWRGEDLGQSLLFAVLLFECLALLDLPASIYFGFIREHAYGMSHETWPAFAWDELKSHAVMALSVSCLGFGVFGLARRLKRWWLVLGLACGGALTVSAALDPYRSQLFIEQHSLPEGPLRERLIALLAHAGVEVADIKVDETSAKSVRLQAYFAGTGPTRTVVLNDALVAALTPEEVAAAVAHEAGHVSERRWVGSLGAALALLALLWGIDHLLRRAAAGRWWGVDTVGDVRVLPLIVLVFDLTTMCAEPFSAAQSRDRERAADAFALALTHDPASFTSMLVKAARINRMDPSPPRWYVLTSLSHPPVSERIETARQWPGRASP